MSILNPFQLFREMKQFRKDTSRARQIVKCPVCGSDALFLDAVDFNKSCEEAKGILFPPSGISVEYYLCDQCGFCFPPELHAWSFDDFARLIYNNEYELVDPDYKFTRPIASANFIEQLFGAHIHEIRHLDYGGGSGLTSQTLRKSGWNSHTYDPFVDQDVNPDELGNFDLVTAFEVFEHVSDVAYLFDNLKKLCDAQGLILFSTFLSDGYIARSQKLDWWYASPRNGHISLFSQRSLSTMMSQRNLKLVSLSPNLHMAFSQVPKWASHIPALNSV